MKTIYLWPFLLSATLNAQNDLQAGVNLQFRFANPGARALAMGGAFIGLADDTSALFANPAGLTQMRSNTLIFEANRSEHDHNIPFYQGSIDQTDLQDFTFNLQDKNFSERKDTIPFLAYVNASKTTKWGVFLAEQADFNRTFQTLGVAIPFYNPNPYVERFELEFFPPSENYTQLSLRSLGFALARNLSQRLSAGITIAYNQFDYAAGSIFRIPNVEELFPGTSFSPRELALYRAIYGENYVEADMLGEDRQVSYYGGMLYTPTPRFSLGLAFKKQPKFEYQYKGRGRDENFEWQEALTGDATFKVPDSYGLGISFKPTDVTVFSVEVNRIQYSQLADDYLRLFENDDDPVNASQDIADITEYHLGFEYVITSTSYPLALRLGYYHEPYHALQNTTLDTQLLFRYLNTNDTQVQGSRASAFLQQFSTDLNHLSAGLGLSLGRHLSLDVATDIDETDSIFSFSSIYRF